MLCIELRSNVSDIHYVCIRLRSNFMYKTKPNVMYKVLIY